MEYDQNSRYPWLTSWQSARDICSAIPGDFRLPVPLNEAENNFLATLNEGVGMPIGITDKDAEGTWVNFYTGEVLNYTNWDSGEPDNNYPYGTQGYPFNYGILSGNSWTDFLIDAIRPHKVVCMEQSTSETSTAVGSTVTKVTFSEPISTSMPKQSITKAPATGQIDDDWKITDKPCEFQTFDDAETICNTKYVGLRIPICAFVNKNTSNAYLGFVENVDADDACSGEQKGDWQFFNALIGCNTVKTTNETHIIYSNNVGGKIFYFL